MSCLPLPFRSAPSPSPDAAAPAPPVARRYGRSSCTRGLHLRPARGSRPVAISCSTGGTPDDRRCSGCPRRCERIACRGGRGRPVGVSSGNLPLSERPPPPLLKLPSNHLGLIGRQTPQNRPRQCAVRRLGIRGLLHHHPAPVRETGQGADGVLGLGQEDGAGRPLITSQIKAAQTVREEGGGGYH